MKVLFEEHAAPQRAGGIEAATLGLIASLAREGVLVTRSFTDAPSATGAAPDCVHIHGIWSPTLARRFLGWRRLGIPCVVTLHGMLEPWALAHKALKKNLAWHLYQKRILNCASALHATSEREAANLRKLGLKPRIETIPWGVEVEGEDRDQESGVKGQGPEVRSQESGVRDQGSEVRGQRAGRSRRTSPIRLSHPQSTIHNPHRAFCWEDFSGQGAPDASGGLVQGPSTGLENEGRRPR